jgi:hypothetical protein
MRALLGLTIAALLILTGCSGSELPLKMKIDRIEVYTLTHSAKKEFFLSITDPNRIEAIKSAINGLTPTAFDDPESPGNQYELQMIHARTTKVLIYVDKGWYKGTIYTKSSAKKGEVWATGDRFAELLLGDKRMPFSPG